jgi:flavin-dependent dehydrogenase
VAKRFDFSKAKVVGRRGGLIPCGGVVGKWHADQVMLLGDSAGMVSSTTVLEGAELFGDVLVERSADDKEKIEDARKKGVDRPETLTRKQKLRNLRD